MAIPAVSPSGRRDNGPQVAGAAWNSVEVIARSHERSAAFGLSATIQPDYGVLRPADLTLKREQNRELCSHAFAVMETLYEQIVNTHSMVVLTDADGLILHSLGDDDFLARADKVALRAGAVWSEQQQGTNAIGTTIAEGEATTVHGSQHYLRANQFLACSSVPILDPLGQLMGVLDVTGDSRSHHQHTMALAKMSAQMIENHLFTQAYTEALRVHFHSRVEFIGTLMEGIAAFGADGRFLSANRSAQFQLGLPLAGLHAHTLSSLFNMSAGALIDRVRGGLDREVQLLCLHSGVNVHAHIEFRRPSMAGVEAFLAQPAELPADSERQPAPALARRDSPVGAGAHKPARRGPESRLSGLRYLATGDAQLEALLAKVGKVLDKPIPILIGGETGTGKDVLASAIHRDSRRGAQAFVAVNCGSIPEALIEAELFGYAPGAYTGAARGGSAGKIAQADGGTLFLDEIGDMPYALQSRLLRVLQERAVVPLGSAQPIPVDFALICASHRNLRERVASGAFREDLYYRINGLQVILPPLRERTDLAATVEKLLRTECGMNHGISVSAQVLALFGRHRWPGNFRQLSNVLQTACAMLERHETQIGWSHLPADFIEEARQDALPATDLAAATSLGDAADDAHAADAGALSLDALAATAVAHALATHRGNVSAAARALGVSRNTLYRKLANLPQAMRESITK